MHDISFFLLKNWLPVGVSAILFFGIGLLLAKFIWGRYTQRLANAIEENMNLASQWSALGASQQDLFKKLRVRWQEDRDAYESVLAEKEARLSLLGNQLRASGSDVSALAEIPAADVEVHKRVKELETALATEKAEALKLREELDKMAELPILPFAMKGHAEPPAAKSDESLQTRLRELEQDLIDTHDELHKVRGDYEMQAKLVESLEARLIAAPAASEQVAVDPVELVQIRALMTQRAREMRQLRGTPGKVTEEALDAVRAEAQARLQSLQAERDAATAEHESREKVLLEAQAALESAAREAQAQLEAQAKDLSAQIEAKNAEISRLEADLAKHVDELEQSKEQVSSLEPVVRRKASLQAELNDACHELYDVRRALNQRIEVIAGLEQRLEHLSQVDAKNASLELELEGTRSDLANALQSLAETDLARAAGAESLAALQSLHESDRTDAAAVSTQLNEARRELSDLRISLAAKTEDYQKALGQMEELEAIIGDRTAEVNDLSTELRQQRDLVRQLKNTLAETQGELEALTEESRVLNAGVKARVKFGEELQARIGSLELALAERYRELNRSRVEAEEHSRNSKHFESKAVQLESELLRRAAEFDASDRRIASVEEALEAAQTKIGNLSSKLEQAEASLGQLREELQAVSREKEEHLRDLDLASRRVTELEEAARKREAQIVELERSHAEAGKQSASLELKVERLQAELESAREERRLSQVAVSELEDALRAGDERTLELSHRLDEKEVEASRLSTELDQLQALVDAKAAGETEAQVRLASLQSELEEKLAEFQLQQEAAAERHARELTLQSGEVVTLQEKIAELESRLAEGAAQREANHSEVEALREKLASRVEEIRDLQNQISEVMMQRASRDTEVALLKEKLLSMEAAAAQAEIRVSPEPVEQVEASEEVAPEALVSPYALLETLPEEEGIPLDELPGQKSHHTPQKAEVPEPKRPEPGSETFSWNAGDEAFTVFFNESAYVLSRAETEKVDHCARSIRRLGKKVEVILVGYAGSEGTPDFNESLSARRADAVRERLIERGVSVSVLKVRAAGQDRRFTDWKARRVELILSPVAAAETVN